MCNLYVLWNNCRINSFFCNRIKGVLCIWSFNISWVGDIIVFIFCLIILVIENVINWIKGVGKIGDWSEGVIYF